MGRIMACRCRRCGFGFAVTAADVKDAESVSCPRCKEDILLPHQEDEDVDDFDETGEDDLARLTAR